MMSGLRLVNRGSLRLLNRNSIIVPIHRFGKGLQCGESLNLVSLLRVQRNSNSIYQRASFCTTKNEKKPEEQIASNANTNTNPNPNVTQSQEPQKEQQKEQQKEEKTSTSEDTTNKSTNDKDATPKKKNLFSIENVTFGVVLSVIAGVIGYFTLKSKTRKAEDRIRIAIQNAPSVNEEEIEQLRVFNNLDSDDITKLMEEMRHESKKLLEDASFTYEEIEKMISKSSNNKKLLNNFLLIRAVDGLQDRNKHNREIPAKEWILFLTMISKVLTPEERTTIVFYTLDSDRDGRISPKELEHFLDFASEMGWCFDKIMYKRTQFIPPKFEVCDIQELTKFVLDAMDLEAEKKDPPAPKPSQTGITLETFNAIPIKLR